MKIMKGLLVVAIQLAMSGSLVAQEPGSKVETFHDVLRKLNEDMLPLTEDLVQVCVAIAGFGTLWYIGYRVWRHLAAAEAIDFFPLLKPLVITLLLANYPIVLSVMNGILYPVVMATDEMVVNSNKSVAELLKQRGKAILNSEEWRTLAGGLGSDSDKWEKYNKQEEPVGVQTAMNFSISLITNGITYLIKLLIAAVLEIVYYAAALCIDTMRSFQLLILSILGPLVFALAAYDGFSNILVTWISRYINVYLWLPIANIFSTMIAKIQAGMLEISIADMESGNLIGFGQTDIAYMIFLIIAIFGYFSIPTTANYIVQGAGSGSFINKMAHTAMLVKGIKR